MKRKRWTHEETETLIRLYPDTKASELAALLGHPLYSIYHRAQFLGLKKGSDFLKSSQSGRIQGESFGKNTRFKKGHIPANKGLKRPGYAPGRMKESQFGNGNKPYNWMPVGSERIFEGYHQRKVTDTGYPPRDWKFIHRLLWEEANGPIPSGHVVMFVDGDLENLSLSNLCLASRSEIARKNTMWGRYPRELAETIQLAGVLKRKINGRTKREKQD